MHKPNPLEVLLVEVAGLRAFVRARGVPTPDVDDVLQMIRLRIWRLASLIPARAGNRPEERAAWLRAVARFVSAEHREARRTARHVGALEEPRELAAAPSPAVDDVLVARGELVDLLEHAAPHHRELLVLVALGMTAPEIAAELGITPRAVMSRLHVARRARRRRR